MEYMELLNKIMDAERRAQQIAAEAKAKRDSLPDDLRAERKKLRDEYLARAERRVQAVAAQEELLANEQIEQLDRALAEDIWRVDAFFFERHDEMVTRLFDLVVGP